MKSKRLIGAGQLFGAAAAHGMLPDRAIFQRQEPNANKNVSLMVTNQCSDAIWPAIATQAGDAPGLVGFELSPGATQDISVRTNWNGRVWGRTNCTFDERGGGTCSTGDCGGNLTCTGTASDLPRTVLFRVTPLICRRVLRLL